MRKTSALMAFLSVVAVSSCGISQYQQTESSLNTVNIPNTQIKWQSIGNCWLYAAMGWAEALVLRSTGVEENYSETYLTYRHFQLQLAEGYSIPSEISTGGSWIRSTSLATRFGLMREVDFIPQEVNKTKSMVQSRAESFINNKLKNVEYANTLKATKYGSRERQAMVEALLDEAFGVKIAEVASKAIMPSDIMIKTVDGKTSNLASEYSRWEAVSYGSYNSKELLQRLKRAMNAHEPAAISWFVDFNALDNKGIFSKETLDKKGMGSQGYHQTVLEDYVVSGVNPLTGEAFSVLEGEATAEEKELAYKYGNIDYFIIKNSWGGDDRLDRDSYTVGGKKGFHRLNADYIFGQLDEKSGTQVYKTSGLNDVIVPKKGREINPVEPTPKPTVTPVPTATPVPTVVPTVIPEPTAVPTVIPTPVPTAIPEPTPVVVTPSPVLESCEKLEDASYRLNDLKLSSLNDFMQLKNRCVSFENMELIIDRKTDNQKVFKDSFVMNGDFKATLVGPSKFHTEQLGRFFMSTKKFKISGYGTVVYQNGSWGVSLIGNNYTSWTPTTGRYVAKAQ